jgi:hypothetical protein
MRRETQVRHIVCASLLLAVGGLVWCCHFNMALHAVKTNAMMPKMLRRHAS